MLVLKKNTLLNLAVKERKILKREGRDFMFRKFDLINTWQGSLLYFFILVLTIFILKRYFILNVNVIEIQNIENKTIDQKSFINTYFHVLPKLLPSSPNLLRSSSISSKV